MIGIYKITNLTNNKVYIGQSVNITRRLQEHKTGHNKNSSIDQAIRQEGLENFKFEIIECCNFNNLNEREKYWIQYYNSYLDGYNDTAGGAGRPKLTLEEEEQIVKLYDKNFSITNISLLINHSHSCVRNCLLRHGRIVKNNSFYASFEDLEDIKDFIFELYEQYYSIKEIQTIIKKDHNRISNFLKLYDYEVDDKRNLRKKVAQIDITTLEVVAIYDSLYEAAQAIHGDKSNISKACLGKRKVAYGFIWKYIE